MRDYRYCTKGFRTVAVLLVAGALMAGLMQCAVNPVTGRSELMLLSEADEVQMGNELYPNALWAAEGGGGEYKDQKLKAYLQERVMRIHRASHRPNLPLTFAVQNTSVPNAWAIPGHVVITRGLVVGLENEAEFVYVMGHEMGHVSARHSARQTTYGMLQQVALAAGGVALGDAAYADLALGLGAVGSSLVLLKYSRDDELEADRLGVQYMTKLGYDPRNAISAHRNLEKVSNEYLRSLGKDPTERGAFEDLLSTHPRTQVRLDELQRMIDATPRQPLSGDGTMRSPYQSSSAQLRKVNAVYAAHYDPAVREYKQNNMPQARTLVQRAIAADGSQAPFHTLLGFINLKEQKGGDAERNFTKALSLDKDYQPALRGMGVTNYAQKDYRDATAYLQKALAIFPDDASSGYFLGMSYYRARDYKSAIPPLKVIASAQPKHPTINGVLGECYDRTGDAKSAYTFYMKQLQVDPSNDVGKQSAARAKELRGISR